MHTEEPYVLEALPGPGSGRLCLEDAGGGGHRAGHPHVLQGAIYLSPRVTNAVVQAYLIGAALPPDPLTSREREVLQRRGGADDEGDRGAPGAERQNCRVASHQPDAEAGHS